MADFGRIEDPPHPADHLGRGQAQRLVDGQPAVDGDTPHPTLSHKGRGLCFLPLPLWERAGVRGLFLIVGRVDIPPDDGTGQQGVDTTRPLERDVGGEHQLRRYP